MGRIAPGSARLVFADPPYNIGVDYGDHHDDRMEPSDYLAWCRRWIEASARLLTPDGSMWLLCNHEWSARLRIAMEDAGLHHRQTITWYETFGVNCTHKFNRCSRPMFWMTKHPRRFVFDRAAVNVPSARQTKYGDRRAAPTGRTSMTCGPFRGSPALTASGSRKSRPSSPSNCSAGSSAVRRSRRTSLSIRSMDPGPRERRAGSSVADTSASRGGSAGRRFRVGDWRSPDLPFGTTSAGVPPIRRETPRPLSHFPGSRPR
jgi:hypothetical protein